MITPTLDSSQLQALPIEMVRYHREQAAERLRDLRQESSSTTNRTYQLIGLQLGIITLLTGYLYGSPSHTYALPATISLLTSLCASCAILLRVIFPRHYMPSGRTLQEMHVSQQADFYIQHPDIPTELRTKQLLHGETIAITQAIAWQEASNCRRVRLVKCSLLILASGITLSMLLFILC